MGEPAVESPARAGRAISLWRPRPGPFTRHQIAVTALALGIVLFTQVLRVFLPSLITLFGRAGDTPPEQMGLYAALWFVLPFAAVPLARAAGPRRVVLGGAILLAAVRLALQATDGGSPQLYLAGAGVSLGLVFLYGCALTVPRKAAPTAIAAGLAVSAVGHLALGQMDLVWRDGPLPWLAVVALCAAFLWSVWLAPVAEDVASGRLWVVLACALVLNGMYLETIGLAEPPGSGRQGPAQIAIMMVVLVAGQFGMVSFAAWPPHQWWVAIVVLPLSAVLMIVSSSAVPAPFAALALGACLAMAGLPRASSPARSGLALLGGMLVFLVAVFVYYAAYDIDLGVANGIVPGLLAVLISILAFTAAKGRRMLLTRPPHRWRFAALALVVAAATAAVTWRPLPAVQAAPRAEFTLVAYNIRMGFGLRGTLDLDRIAAWARSERPDVILLSEVDRGWLLNGGHDGLARIAGGLGMRYHFAPAADGLWGDAIITNLPIGQIVSHPLGRHDYPTGAQAQTVVVEVGGTEVGIVNTHLQAPPGQAPEVAAIARDLAVAATRAGTGGPRPVVLAGDLNITPDDPEMRVLEAAGLSDAFHGRGNPLTSPADNPVKRIDHVLVSPGLAVVDARVPRVTFSDHLPVVVRMRVTRV
ncbi:hypothetical protein GCM10022226_35030 [Sphaerisporangium flaviroseum]|uniref:Endonuclease/exonuclease/phosphatase domain-containing protein n=1 Tax=Sphaerisporangium flaviroseum TaxID=509199 RepID=A0ABP7I7I6_9ACTN